jgi:hypothetical protein
MTRLMRWFVIGCSASLLTGSVLLRAQTPAPASAVKPAPSVDFAKDIQPILEQHCAECHGRSKARARLRLHTPQHILKGGQSGPAIVPGKSDASELIRRVIDPNDDDRMPLDADPLPEDVVARLRAWIDQGAVMPAGTAVADADPVEEHWAYVKPVRPELPPVKKTDWIRTPIDQFVLAHLQRENLTPAAEAPKAALLRRLSLDLTGLPPTPQELEAFIADSSANAYEKVVDRLLASPHYGERWARPWLDLARYADTNGYEKDNRRSIWKFRDWVIDALNQDMPFDAFTIEQIAGDMLPNATIAQQIASGFHRNAMTNEEGGVDPEESRYEVLVDRVNTTATVWLGTTLACAQCHNHKYDPFSQKDYFRLLAFFANSDFDSRSFGDGTRYFEPTLDLATPEQEKARKELQAKIDQIDKELKTVTPEVAAAQQEWEQSIRAAHTRWTPLTPKTAGATNGVILKVQPDGSVLASGPNPALTSYTVTADTTLERITALRLEAVPDPSLPRGGPGRDGYGHFRVTGFQVEAAPGVRPGSNRGQTGVRPAAAASPLPALREPHPSTELGVTLSESKGQGRPEHSRGTSEAGSHASAGQVAFKTLKVDDSAYPFEPADLLSQAAPAADRKRGSWAVNAMRDTERVPRHAVLAADTPFGFAGGTRITVRIDHLDGTIGQGIGRFRLSVTDATDPLEGADLPARLRPVLAMPAAERSRAQAEELAGVFRATTPLLKSTRDALAAARKALADLQIPSTLVMKERASFERPSYDLRERGSFEARGDRQFAATPGALHAMRPDQPINRLGLARWLIDKDNPLVARVAVNRMWEQIFGRGLVETSEDFGTQGTSPTHPELLDWLATELTSRGWSQKTIIRTIVLSSTYRQSSVTTPELSERDPYNRLFARGPRVRMEAEMIRDVALAVSGLLSAKMYGPSVFPLQPDGIWNMPYNSDKWATSSGEDRHRRSLYTFWRRTSPYPSFMTFDATSREFCTVRRVRTNTPLQALTLLNDPSYFEAARALAERMMKTAPDPRARVAHGIKLVLSREAQAPEVDRLVKLLDEELATYRGKGDAQSAEIAAWTVVANVMLNLDEAVTKE